MACSFSTRGFRVTNPDGSSYTLASEALKYNDDEVPTVSSFTFEGAEVAVGSVRGLGLDEEGFVLIVITNSDIYQFNSDSLEKNFQVLLLGAGDWLLGAGFWSLVSGWLLLIAIFSYSVCCIAQSAWCIEDQFRGYMLSTLYSMPHALCTLSTPFQLKFFP